MSLTFALLIMERNGEENAQHANSVDLHGTLFKRLFVFSLCISVMDDGVKTRLSFIINTNLCDIYMVLFLNF